MESVRHQLKSENHESDESDKSDKSDKSDESDESMREEALSRDRNAGCDLPRWITLDSLRVGDRHGTTTLGPKWQGT
jgi:hypothetical protein